MTHQRQGLARYAGVFGSSAAVLAGMIVLATAGIFGGDTARASHTAFTTALPIPPVLTGANINLEMREADIQILPGAKTRMWTYNGIFPGPTIRRPSGQNTNVTVTNNMPASFGSATLHNHGNHSSPENDGQPDTFLIAPGANRTYQYTGIEEGVDERAATQWYHDHRMDVTARNVWMGLAGFYILDDSFEAALPLPKGEFDVPLMVLDRQFNSTNQIPYTFNFNGATGNHILVNGAPQPFFNVGDRRYRFRILNASSTREYNLELSNGQAMTQIGTDGGLLPAPVSRTRILIGPAERVDIVIDFAGRLNQNIVLRSRSSSWSSSSLDVMQFRVTRDLTDDSSVPATLRPLPAIGNPTVTRTWNFDMGFDREKSHTIWSINGVGFDPNRVDAYPKRDSTEKWVLRNSTNVPHQIHIHDVDQQCLTRNGRACGAFEKMKEVWRLGPWETVEVKFKPTDHLGRYVFHCHVIEHEDMEMMGQFEVVP